MEAALSGTAGLSRGDLLRRMQAMKNRVVNAKVKGEALMGSAITLGEIGGTAFLMSYLNGKMAPATAEWAFKIGGMNIPVDATVGAVLWGAGAFGHAFGVKGTHLEAIGAGAIASYGARKGLQMGVASTHPLQLSTGAAPASSVGAAPASSVGAAPASSVGALPSGWGRPAWAPAQQAGMRR